MRLFIKINNGAPVDHPMLEDNFVQAFPDIDTSNLPKEFALFERVPKPLAGMYEVVEGPEYKFVDGVVKDVWSVRPMTDEEVQSKNKLLTDSLYAYRDAVKLEAQQSLADATNDLDRKKWQDYIARLDAYVVTDLSGKGFPAPIVVTDTTASGSAPDVIG